MDQENVKFKKIKDPIYGYITIPADIVTHIIDTSSFQRLRRILQTSYTPLYPSTLHNRFIHSLGVYHLGKIAVNHLKTNSKLLFVELKIEAEIDHLCDVFVLACLLHDVGHAPFSHTGETFYLNEKNNPNDLHKILSDEVGSDTFRTDIQNIQNTQTLSAAPHEIVSAIVGLREYGDLYITQEGDKEFFARCIVGYKYSSNIDHIKEIKNCLITLLNSKIMDVDKLDYLIRDAHFSGFDTVNIDYMRLLSSITIEKNEDKFEIAYNKNAISVLENVIYAHDAERKWIQSHPSVLYEAYLLRNIITHISGFFNKGEDRLFSIETLSQAGKEFNIEGKGNFKIKLLCDDDIIYLMKSDFENPISKEYFERKDRRHPLWKSETEYKSHFIKKYGDGDILSELEKALSLTYNYVMKNTELWVINDELIQQLQNDIRSLEESSINIDTKNIVIQQNKTILKIMETLREFAADNELPCDFIILENSPFNSGFGKPDFLNALIALEVKKYDPDTQKTIIETQLRKFGDVVSSIQAKEKTKDKLFFIYYKRNGTSKELNTTKLISQLIHKFMD